MLGKDSCGFGEPLSGAGGRQGETAGEEGLRSQGDNFNRKSESPRPTGTQSRRWDNTALQRGQGAGRHERRSRTASLRPSPCPEATLHLHFPQGS